jgi:hypothetical protein
MTMTLRDTTPVNGADAARSQDQLWLTAVLRPAGLLAGPAIARFADELTTLARSANLVVVNLVAASVPDPEDLALALREPGEMLTGPDKCLLLVGASDELLAALDRCGGDIASIEAASQTETPRFAEAITAG